MAWIEKYRRNLRVVIILLLMLAFLGPWAFDLLNVPAKYDCGPLNIRLEGDFCGSPIIGIQVLFWIIGGFFNLIVGFIRGEIAFIQTDFSFWIGLIYSLILILLILPIFNILFMILRGDRPRLQKFHLVVCGLNLIPVLLVGLSRFTIINFALWGVWLYLGVLLSILILEGILLKQIKTDQLMN